MASSRSAQKRHNLPHTLLDRPRLLPSRARHMPRTYHGPPTDLHRDCRAYCHQGHISCHRLATGLPCSSLLRGRFGVTLLRSRLRPRPPRDRQGPAASRADIASKPRASTPPRKRRASDTVEGEQRPTPVNAKAPRLEEDSGTGLGPASESRAQHPGRNEGGTCHGRATDLPQLATEFATDLPSMASCRQTCHGLATGLPHTCHDMPSNLSRTCYGLAICGVRRPIESPHRLGRYGRRTWTWWGRDALAGSSPASPDGGLRLGDMVVRLALGASVPRRRGRAGAGQTEDRHRTLVRVFGSPHFAWRMARRAPTPTPSASRARSRGRRRDLARMAVVMTWMGRPARRTPFCPSTAET